MYQSVCLKTSDDLDQVTPIHASIMLLGNSTFISIDVDYNSIEFQISYFDPFRV